MSNRDTAATVDYHEATKHSEQSTRASRHFLDWENKPLPFKIYRELEPIPEDAQLVDGQLYGRGYPADTATEELRGRVLVEAIHRIVGDHIPA